jgi:intraflagellar transport protein 88
VQVEVLYQVADCYILKGDRKRAKKMLQLTYDFADSEPRILAKLGSMHAEAGERDESLHCYLESYGQFPSVDTLALICAQHVHDENYEVAARYFRLAARMQPSEPKWVLMVASCHRRAQKYEKAMDLYEEVRLQTVHLGVIP